MSCLGWQVRFMAACFDSVGDLPAATGPRYRYNRASAGYYRRHPVPDDQAGEKADQFTRPEPFEEMVIATVRKVGYGHFRDNATDYLETLIPSLPFVWVRDDQP
jgi:hypothetical protein